ncbi:MAG: hypothetical protein ACOC9W_00690 [Persicimonas sp.]
MAAAQSRQYSATPDQVTFLVVHCPACEREVLTARDLDEDGRIGDLCLHCEQPVDRRHPSAQWLVADQLVERGYFIDGHQSLEDRHGGSGCRDGSCGVQQPDH